MTSIMKAQALAKLSLADDRMDVAHVNFMAVCNEATEDVYTASEFSALVHEIDNRRDLFREAQRERDEARKAYDVLAKAWAYETEHGREMPARARAGE